MNKRRSLVSRPRSSISEQEGDLSQKMLAAPQDNVFGFVMCTFFFNIQKLIKETLKAVDG